eukprot:TRINITY_DN2554_c0_g1_i1.p1 TRINITY_DN2554_c0_g1~~TRINITY_DN2554_c0_g1_i1.p1  ORF type:complete len:430 (+),score=30.62 TRINITY_DN2554_c0_g1_i1:58-1290(+)
MEDYLNMQDTLTYNGKIFSRDDRLDKNGKKKFSWLNLHQTIVWDKHLRLFQIHSSATSARTYTPDLERSWNPAPDRGESRTALKYYVDKDAFNPLAENDMKPWALNPFLSAAQIISDPTNVGSWTDLHAGDDKFLCCHSSGHYLSVEWGPQRKLSLLSGLQGKVVTPGSMAQIDTFWDEKINVDRADTDSLICSVTPTVALIAFDEQEGKWKLTFHPTLQNENVDHPVSSVMGRNKAEDDIWRTIWFYIDIEKVRSMVARQVFDNREKGSVVTAFAQKANQLESSFPLEQFVELVASSKASDLQGLEQQMKAISDKYIGLLFNLCIAAQKGPGDEDATLPTPLHEFVYETSPSIFVGSRFWVDKVGHFPDVTYLLGWTRSRRELLYEGGIYEVIPGKEDDFEAKFKEIPK